jgi:hypothetical protein
MIGRKLIGIPLKLTLGEKNLKKGWWRSSRGEQVGFFWRKRKKRYLRFRR